MPSITGNNRGAISLKALFWLTLAISATYIGIKFVPTYFAYYVFKGEVAAEATTSDMRHDVDILSNILKKAREWEIPVGEKDVVINRRNSEIEIAITYEVDIDFFNRYKKTLFFDIHTVKPIMQR